MTKVTKFSQMITNGSDALQKRASAVEVKAELAMRTEIDKLKNSKVDLQLKNQDLLDFSPESTTSLKPSDTDWASWASSIKENDIQIEIIDRQLVLLEKRYEDLFKEVTE